MARANKNNDSPTFDKKTRVKIMTVVFLAAVVAIVLCLAFIKKTSENMLVHIQDRPNAVIKILKECAEQTKAEGLANADAIKANDQCFKQKIAELDAKR